MAFNYIGFRSYFTGEDCETTLTEGNERVADETSSIFSETSSPDMSDGNLCEGSDEKLRNQNLENKIKKLTEKNQCLELEIKNLKESCDKELGTKTAEVLHYAKSLKEQEERHQGELQDCCKQRKRLERTIEELTKSLNSMKSEKQKMERAYTAKSKQSDDYSKRLAEERTKSMRLSQNLNYFSSRLSQEESKSKKLEDELHYYYDSYNHLRDSYNNDLKKMAREIDYLNTRLSKKDEELRVLREELREKTARLD